MGRIVFGLLILWIIPVVVYAVLAYFQVDLGVILNIFNNPFSGIIGSALRLALTLWVIIGMVDVLGVFGAERKISIGYEMKHVQALIAGVVVFAFAIAAISGQVEGANALKDLALVVVGFYFGTKVKDGEDIKWLKKGEDKRDVENE